MSEYKGDDVPFYLQLYTEAATLFANAKELDRRFAAALSPLFKPIHNCVFAALPPTHAHAPHVSVNELILQYCNASMIDHTAGGDR